LRIRETRHLIRLFGAVLTLAAPARGDEPASPSLSLRNADRQLLRGDDDRAGELYRALAGRAGYEVIAACGLAEIDLRRGAYLDGIRRLNDIRYRGAADPRWHTVLAALLAEIGEYDKARLHNQEAIGGDADALRPRWQLGMVLETLGRTEEAIRVYRAFDEIMTDEALPEEAADLTYLGLGFNRYNILSRHRDLVQRTRHILTEIYQEAFEFVDSAYWPARLAAAELLLGKHNLPEAKEDFERALEINPHAPEARIGLGRIALEKWDFQEVEKQVEAALLDNPRSVAARVLLADTRMTERRYGDAEASATEALETNPRSIEALSVLAAAQLRQNKKDAYDRTLKDIADINDRCARLHHALGTWLAAGRQFSEAETQLKKAIDLAPWWPELRTSLGEVYMELGEEARARRELEDAFTLDSFNARTHNVLNLLDELDAFARRETEHFIIKYDEEKDGILADYFADALDQIYRDVCEDFDARPDFKTLVEIFPDHMGLSVRITGRPFIATVGACSGRVIAMQAPRGRAPFGRFNWSTVLRHEFTHVVTLAATDNRIPHWMTEGMAVFAEPGPRSWAAKQVLSDAVRQDRLFTLESIDWGFMRPRRPDDRHLAYAQSEWMIEYAIERYGYRIFAEFLTAFRDRLTQGEAFEKVLKTDPARFFEDFRAWAAKHVEAWALPVYDWPDEEKVLDALKKRRDDPRLWAQLAEIKYNEGELDEARQHADRALDDNPNFVPALRILSRTLIARMLGEKDEAGRRDWMREAEPHIRRLARCHPHDAETLLFVGYLEQVREQWNEAIAALSAYQRRMPENPDSFRRLAGIYLQQDRTDDALRELKQLARLVEDEPFVARTIAEIHADRDEPAVAARWYRRALESNPYDRAIHEGLAASQLLAGDLDAARREYETIVRYWPERESGYEGLARVHEALGDLEASEAFKEKGRRRRAQESGGAADDRRDGDDR
jgi:tetratricopeptide (TPR) repeat protein